MPASHEDGSSGSKPAACIATVDEKLEDPRDLLVHSDIAMYRAKETGRNCVAFFDVDLKAKVAERAELEDYLRLALQRNELALEFQPKLCARTNAVVGVEALARWFHPTRGAISPDTFIPIAEQSGSMGELGDVVLQLTTLQSAAWSRGGIELPVAVNVSPVRFESPDLVDDILQCLERGRIDPALIELEITETLAMFDYPASKRRVDELRATGVRVAIDDFGTGYSNLSQLARLNVDTIKIDRSLVSGIGQNAKSEAMLEATINMARALGHTIVAEGIENMEQFVALRELGCDHVQGFFVARPMTAIDLDAWMKSRSANGIGIMHDEISARIHAV